ncbi:hypothetical protein ACHAXT_005452 [Thalassiosira profunda]
MEHLVAAVEEEEAAAATATAMAASAAAGRTDETLARFSARGDAQPPMDVDDEGAEAMDVENNADDDAEDASEGEDFVAPGDRSQDVHRNLAAPDDPQAQASVPDAANGRAIPPPSPGTFPTWQTMFRQLQDFHALGHRQFPPRMALWMNSQRRRYKTYGLGLAKPTGILVNRIRQLNSIDFDWHAPPYKPESDSEGDTGESEEDELSDEESLRPRSRRGRDERDHDPGAKNWTPEEDEVIDSMQAEYGNKWSIIAAELGTGRTSDEIKNRWGWMYRRGLVGGDAPKSSRTGSVDDGYRTLQRQDSGDRLGGDRRPYGRHVEGMVKAALEEDRQKAHEKKYGRSSRARRAASRRGDSTDDSSVDVGGYGSYSTAGRRGSGYDSMRSDVVSGGRKKNVKTAFPSLLSDMVTDCTENEPHVCEWTREGDAVIIKNAGLMPPAIGRYFQHSNYRSLQRMMYHYNFKRCSDEYDGVYYHPNFNRWSTKQELVDTVLKGGDPPILAKRGRGRPKGSVKVPQAVKKKRESRREKLFERIGEGAAHPSLLFEDEEEEKEEEEESVEETRVTNPGSADVALSLKFPAYRKVMFTQFQRVGRKTPEGDDADEMKELAKKILVRIQRMTRTAGGRKGRLLKAIKGKTYYEVVDAEWALDKIGSDLRRRMESSHNWLNKTLTDVDDYDYDAEPMDLEPQPGKSDELAAPADDIDAARATSHDLVVSLMTPKYRAAMFARFQELGEKADEDDPQRIKATGKALLDGFKKDLGETGRFFRRARGAGDDEAPLEVIDDEAALTRIEQDLRRRMESANSWLNVKLDALPEKGAPKSEQEPSDIEKPDVVDSADSDVVMAGAPDSPPSAAKSAAPPPNWNLGSLSTSVGVLYYKSSIGKYWVEQVVPRKTVRDRGPNSDSYYLSPDGMRFRSKAEVQRFLEETGLVKTESGEEESHEEELAENGSAVSYESEEEDGSDRLSPTPMPCNCKKSKCLKLYCDCFNKERYCAGCACVGCRNTPVYDAQRDRAIADLLEKNPDAFKRHSGTGIECKCTRTACLKKYCECFAAGQYCGVACKCRDCENLPLDTDEGGYGEEAESVEDGSGEEEEARQDGRVSSFAGALHELVSYVNTVDPSTISWAPGGEAFFVHDVRKEQLGKYIEMFFRHNNYSSLQRQLANYGFRHQVGGRLDGAYYHEHFHRDVESMGKLNRNIRRLAAESGYAKKSESSKKRRAVSDASLRPYKVHAPAAGGQTITMKCPHCLEVKVYQNPGTAAASFSNHVRACGQKGGLKKKKSPSPGKASPKTCPHCHREFHVSGYLNHVNACKMKSGAAESPGKASPGKSSPKKCPHCSREFHVSGYLNHVNACKMKSGSTESPEAKPTRRQCPHCKKDFHVSGYLNHANACSQNRETKPRATESPEAKSTRRQCPHCKKDFHVSGFNNHVNACGQKKPEAKPMKKCPHCSKSFFIAGYSNHVNACARGLKKPKHEVTQWSNVGHAQKVGGKIQMTCPHCLEVKRFSPGTAVASFSNHVKACAKKKEEAKEKGADKKKASPPKKKKAASPKPNAITHPGGVTMACPHCSMSFYYQNPGTAAASFSHHVTACAKRAAAREKAEKREAAKPKSPESGEKLSFVCPKCSREFHFNSSKTAVASFGNHVRRCNP